VKRSVRNFLHGRSAGRVLAAGSITLPSKKLRPPPNVLWSLKRIAPRYARSDSAEALRHEEIQEAHYLLASIAIQRM